MFFILFNLAKTDDTKVKRAVRRGKPETVVEKATTATEESYLDPVKLAYVKNWVQTVNKVQATEGKWADTINKITFYD
jgi:hypothetical protein